MATGKIRNMEEFSVASGISRPTVSRYFHDPDSVRKSTREKIERALRTEQAALDFDPRITNSGGASFSTMLRELILFNSRGTTGRYTGTVASSTIARIM